MAKKTYYAGHEVLFETHLYGRDYFWMKDVDGTIYLTGAKPVMGSSIDPDTGEVVEFIEGYVPVFI